MSNLLASLSSSAAALEVYGQMLETSQNNVVNALVNRDRAADTINFLATRNITEIAGSFWTASNIPPGNLPGFVPAGLKAQGFTNYDAFNFAKHQISFTII